jgi:hemolysin activation/secretion protein
MPAKRILIIAIGCHFTACASILHAIGAEDALRLAIPPKKDVPAEVARRRNMTAEGRVADEQQVLISQLRGIAVTTRPENAPALQAARHSGLLLEGLSNLQARAVSQALMKFLSRPVTLRSLDDMAELVETSLEKQTQLLVKAGFPPQEITAGTVVMVVRPARVDRVILRGNPAFGCSFIQKSLQVVPGDLLKKDQIAADLDWLNENPLRSMHASLSPSAKDGFMDLVLQVDAARSWRVFSGIDNFLSDRLGDWRWYLGLQHGNLWNLDHRLTGMFTSGLDAEALHGGSLTYEIPLPWQHLLETGISYSESRSKRTSGATLIDQSGRYQRYQITYLVPLPRLRGLKLAWRTGLSFRDQLYLLDASRPGAVSVHRSRGWHGLQVETGLTARCQDRFGTTFSNLRLLWNPGSTCLGSSDQAARQLGAGGSQAWLAELTLQRSLKLKHAGTLMARLEGQWSDRALLAADQFSPAVAGRARGFDEITGYGDNGAVLSLEWLTAWQKTTNLGSIRGLLFSDGALVHQRMPGRDVRLLSTGAGVRWQSKALALQCDLGVPLIATHGIETRPRARFSLSLSW